MGHNNEIHDLASWYSNSYVRTYPPVSCFSKSEDEKLIINFNWPNWWGRVSVLLHYTLLKRMCMFINTRGKRNVRNILIFVHQCNIHSTLFRKEYLFSKKDRVYARKPHILSCSSPIFNVSCYLYTWNFEFTAAWYVIFLKILYQLFVPILKS